jgi:predicted ATPase/class 3 adenylate cyclase/DNA-binding NarL/FixJ family response regulator
VADLPTGTVTFLFTDIEGSTKLAQAHPAEWESARQRHHAILRKGTEAHQGYVFQIIGDAFCVAFATASHGLQAALAAQRALQAEAWGETPIRVRMGLHTGAADARGGDYHGYLTVAYVERVMSAAHGGQTLVSNVTAALLFGQLPDDLTLRDLGEHRLKGSLTPQHLWQVVAPDLPQDFPPLESLSTVPNNLPIQLTSFVGREREISELQRLLTTTRLLTLTGVGGVGKTRLALHVAADVLADFSDGAWLVELAPLADPALVPQTVAATINVPEQSGRPILATLKDYLSGKHLLLVLDNCEHLIEACARLAETLLHAAPRLKILASSREALGIAGETTYRVPSLQLPNPVTTAGHAGLMQSDAVRLFCERALAAKPDFVISALNAPSVVQICHRLDGIPLALELAAARIRSLSVEQIATRLDNQFQLLTGGSRTALPRQRTLRAMIDWSYDLLDTAERRLFNRLCVFAGGWTLEAAEASCSTDGPDAAQVMDTLDQLVNKSLIIAAGAGPEARYQMLEILRQYAREKLLESGDEERTRDRHLEYYLQLAETAEPKFSSAELIPWFDRLETEIDNVRMALRRTVGKSGIEKQLRLASALRVFWYTRGHQSECLELLQGLLLRPEAAQRTPARVKALTVLSEYYTRIRTYPLAKLAAEEALSIAEELRDKPLKALALDSLASVYALQGMTEEARPLVEQAIAAYREIGDLHSADDSLTWLGISALRTGDYALARTVFAEHVRTERAVGNKEQLAIALRMHGYAMFYHGDAGASAAFLDSLRLNREIHDRQAIAASLSACAAVAIAQRQTERAARLLGYAAVQLEAIHAEMWPYDNDQYVPRVAALRAQMGEDAFNAAWAQGRALTPDQALAEAEAIESVAARAVPITQTPASATVFPAGLTTREVEVLRLLAQGLTDAQIAEALVVSTRTVNAHLRSIYGKLDVTTRTGAVRAALDLRLW